MLFQEYNRDILIAEEYSCLFVSKLSHLLKSENMAQAQKASNLPCIDRAFKTINLSVENVDILLQTFVRNIEPKNFGHRDGHFLCSVFTNLSKFHALKFMDTLFDDTARWFTVVLYIERTIIMYC